MELALEQDIPAGREGTPLLFTQAGFASPGSRDGHREGWSSARSHLREPFQSARPHFPHFPDGGAAMSTQGRMVWFNLDTGDVQASRHFYTQVVGWGIREWGDCPRPYSMWTADGAPIGGVGEHPPGLKEAGAPPQWIGYVAVEDVDAASTRAEELGGRIHTPGTDIPGVGRFAVVADPQGAKLALLASNGGAPAPDVRRTGSVGWHELHTVDHGAAWEFYSALFGWTHAATIDTGGHGDYFIFRHPGDPEGTMMGAMFDAAGQENRAPEWLYYVNVDDMDGAVARIRDRGGRVLFGPMDVPGGGRSAQCMDPQGGRFAVFALK